MKWNARTRAARLKEPAEMSFFLFVIFFAVFGVILLTKLMTIDVFTVPYVTRAKYDWQSWGILTYVQVETEAPPPPPPAAHEPLDHVWRPVVGTSFKFFVFSAFVERRTEAAVRVIGATKTRNPDPVVCRLFLHDNRTFTLKANVTAIREHKDLKYSATYILCYLRGTGVKPDDTIGGSIAVISEKSLHRPPTNLLTIVDTQPRPDILENVHVCVKPLHFSFANNEFLVEWLEMNMLLGVSHFYIYNESVSSSVDCILRHYQKMGLVDVMPWRLPLKSRVEIGNQGQFAAFNDCLYRSMRNAGWLLNIDIDELVLPRRERTLPSLFKVFNAEMERAYILPPKKTQPAAALLFRNAFFYQLWEDDPKAPAPLVTARKTRRSIPLTFRVRSKYAVRPSEAVELGNHFVWQLLPGAVSTGVSTDRALLHHYRENVHVCVKPLHFSFANNEFLVEWLEMNMLLGVSHFYIYNESVSSSVDCILRHYQKMGLVDVMPWRLPLKSRVEIGNQGQFAAFNDCLYRSMRNAGWLLNIDIDELVLPRRERTLPSLFKVFNAEMEWAYILPPKKTQPAAALLFRNAFFYQLWEDDPKAPAPLVTARKTRRSIPLKFRVRSKYAVRPSEAVELGNHFVWQLLPGAVSIGVSTDRALLHHYRMKCVYGGVQCLTVPSTEDRTAHRWSDELTVKVTKVQDQLKAICPIIKT